MGLSYIGSANGRTRAYVPGGGRQLTVATTTAVTPLLLAQ
jgi:hypothetical protein